MATYDYQCDECEAIQEESHPMAGPSNPIVCNYCGGTNMKKVFIEPPYSKFEGPGWCTNDDRGINKD